MSALLESSASGLLRAILADMFPRDWSIRAAGLGGLDGSNSRAQRNDGAGLRIAVVRERICDF